VRHEAVRDDVADAHRNAEDVERQAPRRYNGVGEG
jgi:hypothetical protein